jgi:hypothetical protein
VNRWKEAVDAAARAGNSNLIYITANNVSADYSFSSLV